MPKPESFSITERPKSDFEISIDTFKTSFESYKKISSAIGGNNSAPTAKSDRKIIDQQIQRSFEAVLSQADAGKKDLQNVLRQCVSIGTLVMTENETFRDSDDYIRRKDGEAGFRGIKDEVEDLLRPVYKNFIKNNEIK